MIKVGLGLPLCCLIVATLIVSINLHHGKIADEVRHKTIVDDSLVGNIRLKSRAIPVQKVGGALLTDPGKDRDITDAVNEEGVYIGSKLNADDHYSATWGTTQAVNIGEPVNADNQLTVYTYETPLNLGENMNASGPADRWVDDQSEYQNIGPDIIVGEESDWRYVKPVNIGATMDADNSERN